MSEVKNDSNEALEADKKKKVSFGTYIYPLIARFLSVFICYFSKVLMVINKEKELWTNQWKMRTFLKEKVQ